MKIFSWVPNFLTICNLLCGCAAIITAYEASYTVTFWLVVAAAIFDFADGLAARALKAYSTLGKELDSLADMVSFGVVPSFVMYSLMSAAGMGGWSYAAFFIAAMSALRLAKFNIDTRQTENFLGLPTPACALFFVSYATYDDVGGWIFAFALLMMFGGLLVSELPMFSFKFKSLAFKDNKLRYFFAAFAGITVILMGAGGVSATIIGYIMVSLVLYIVKRYNSQLTRR